MVSFQPTEDEQAFVDLARDFAKERIRPLARECEQEGRVHPELVKKIEEVGFASLELPESWGGLEMPLISQVQILEALSSGDLGVVQGLPGAGDAASLFRFIPDHPLLASYKEAGQKGTWPTVAFLHAAEGEIPQGVTITSADETGYVLNGTSQPVRLAAFADYLLVSAVDSQGETLLLWLDRQKGNRWQAEAGDYRLGLLASGCARIRFDEEKISSDQVLAKGDEAKDLLAKALRRIQVLEASKEIGLMDAAVSYVTEYTAQRKAFGQEIAKFQGVSFTLAGMAIETQAMRHLVLRAAADIDGDKGEVAASSTLGRVHRALRFVSDSGVQLLGGHGYVQEFPVEKWMRDAEAQTLLYGREGELLIQRGEQLLDRKVPIEV